MRALAIVITYNASEWIEKCLSSLLNSTFQVEILAIDNGSVDDTVKIVIQKFPSVNFIQANKNLGFGKANNIGLKRALEMNVDYVLLLNQDARLERNTIEKLVQASVENPGYGVISPFHMNYDGNGIENYFNDYVIGQYTPGYLHDVKQGSIKNIYPATFIHAACWLIPINVIKTVGGFDPLFFHTGEDNDFVQRLSYRGLKVGFVPAAIMYHKGTNEGLANPAVNVPLKINQAVLKFKNPGASMKGALYLFFRSSFKSMFSALVGKNFKQLKAEVYVFWYNAKRTAGLMKSRKLQSHSAAYLS
jgi:GT2 family glycosyltransferase